MMKHLFAVSFLAISPSSNAAFISLQPTNFSKTGMAVAITTTHEKGGGGGRELSGLRRKGGAGGWSGQLTRGDLSGYHFSMMFKLYFVL